MTDQLADAAYLGAIILFILALGGLSNQETARRGNFYGMLGMAIALIAAVAGIKGNYAVLVGTLSPPRCRRAVRAMMRPAARR